jgi:hypothetical protein
VSLKAFHIVFIILAFALAVGCAVWSFANEVAPGFGYGCVGVAVALFIYGIWFLRKARKIIT